MQKLCAYIIVVGCYMLMYTNVQVYIPSRDIRGQIDFIIMGTFAILYMLHLVQMHFRKK